MLIGAVHRYFWPDSPPYATFLREMASDWAARGHDVQVVAGRPAKRDEAVVPNVPVRRVPVVREGGRLPGQLANLVVFPLGVAAALVRGPRPDVLMCSTAPQVTLGAVVSRIAALRGASFVYHCMDLHPEIGQLSGEFANPLVYRLLRRADTATMRRAARVVVLSTDMRDAVIDRDPTLADKVVVLNNFAMPDDGVVTESPLAAPAPGVVRVVFTGNIGRFQSLPDLVKSLGLLPPGAEVELVFMGAGRALDELAVVAAALPSSVRNRVRFLPAGTSAEAKALMRSAHVGVVSLAPRVARFAYPSKTATYTEQGLPVLAVCDPDTELASTVSTERLGWTAAPGDVAGIASALAAAASEVAGGSFAIRRERVREFHQRTFDRGRVLKRWAELMDGLASERGTAEEHDA